MKVDVTVSCNHMNRFSRCNLSLLNRVCVRLNRFNGGWDCPAREDVRYERHPETIRPIKGK